jgi:ABC-type lipoprotein release transport system permease subunit
MNQLFKMAFRDLLRNKRRTLLSMLALGMGLGLLMLMASVVAGETRDAMQSAINLQTGHLQVRVKNYNSAKGSLKWEDLIENPGPIAAQIAALGPVAAATPRLLATGVISQGDQTRGVSVIGIEPESAASNPYRKGLLSGDYLTADDSSGVLVGRALADKFKLKAGDTINLLVNTSNGNVDQQAFTIRGIYTTRTPSVDENTVLMPLAKAQTITQTQGHASVIFILLKDIDQTPVVASALQSGQYEVKNYLQMNDMVSQFEKMANSYMYLLYLIVLGITATVIVNTLVMSVFERTREIGILAAVGMKSSSIMSMFLIESLLLAVGGVIMGLILGGLLVVYSTNIGFYFGNLGASYTGFNIGETIYGYFRIGDAVALSLVAFIITLLAALYPAILAARLEPVDALHGGKLA